MVSTCWEGCVGSGWLACLRQVCFQLTACCLKAGRDSSPRDSKNTMSEHQIYRKWEDVSR